MIRLFGLLTGISLCIIMYLSWQQPQDAKNLIRQGSEILQEQVDEINILHQAIPEKPVAIKEAVPLAFPIEAEAAQAKQHVPLPEAETARITQESRQQAIWRPFTTLSSAQGFTRYVQDKTGLLLSINSQKQGEYSVMLSYQSENELQQALEKIATLLGTTQTGEQ